MKPSKTPTTTRMLLPRLPPPQPPPKVSADRPDLVLEGFSKLDRPLPGAAVPRDIQLLQPAVRRGQHLGQARSSCRPQLVTARVATEQHTRAETWNVPFHFMPFHMRRFIHVSCVPLHLGQQRQNEYSKNRQWQRETARELKPTQPPSGLA